MRKTTNRSAFTLVELIVVITILAVLATIGFISLQGYSADARNTKRTSDLKSISSAISIKSAEGVPLQSFIKKVTATAIVGANFGGTGSTLDTDYFAGTPNYTALKVSPDEFKDPTDNEYRIALTTKNDGKFELAATLEDGANRKALTKGTYYARSATLTGSVVSVTNNIVTLSPNDTNKFAKGDLLDFSIASDQVVSKINRDGITLTLPDGHGVIVGETVNLKIDETAGLIASKASTSIPVTKDHATNLPY